MNALKFSLDPVSGTLTERDAKRYFSIFGFAVFALVAGLQLGGLLLSYLVGRFAPWMFSNALIYQALSLIPLYGIGVPLCFWVLARLPKDSVLPEKMEGKSVVKGFCVAVALMTVGNYLSNIIISFFAAAKGEMLTNPVESMTEGNAWWINLIFVALLPAILEELVFRKLFCDRLLPLGEGYAIVLSAAAFGLVHGNFFQFAYAFFLGARFSLIYVKTGKLIYSIVYHFLINLLGGVLMAWLAQRLAPLLNEETLNRLMELMSAGDAEAVSALMGEYLQPLTILAVYEIAMTVMAICGVIFLVSGLKKTRLQSGLLPPPREGRVANVFCNAGVAVAITAFAAVFVLSVL